MATEKSRLRKSAVPPKGRSVKTSVTLDAGLHCRLGVAASMAGMSNNAFIVDVLTDALRGIVVIDKRKSPGGVDLSSPEESAA